MSERHTVYVVSVGGTGSRVECSCGVPLAMDVRSKWSLDDLNDLEHSHHEIVAGEEERVRRAND